MKNKSLLQLPSPSMVHLIGICCAAFVASFLIVVAAGFGIDLLTERFSASRAEAATKREQTVAGGNYLQISPDLESGLNNAHYPTSEWSLLSVKNTMYDAEGIGTSNGKPVVVKTALPVAAPGGLAGNLPMGGTNTGTLQPLPGPTPPAETEAALELRTRLAEFDRNARREVRSAALFAEVFSIEDLYPLGGVGGSEAREIKFYNYEHKRYVTLTLNGRVRNGRLVSADDQGVRFVRDGGGDGSEIFRPWVRNLKEKPKADAPSQSEAVVSPFVREPAKQKQPALRADVAPSQSARNPK
jgi:hypothetical protein